MTIELDADAGLAYGHAGVAYLHYLHWKKTTADWTVAAILGVDIRPLFYLWKYGRVEQQREAMSTQADALIV